MRVVLDLTPYLIERNPRGIGKYAISLYSNLLKLKGIEVIAGIKASRLYKLKIRRLLNKKLLIFSQNFAIGPGFQIFHATDWNFHKKEKYVQTLHDLYFMEPQAPKNWAQKKKETFFYIFKKIKPVAVITVSEYTKNEFLKWFPEYESITHLIYPGVSPDFKIKNSEEVKRFLKKFGLKYKEYLLFVGIATDRRKNFGYIVKAITSGLDWPIAIVGTKKEVIYQNFPELKGKTGVFVFKYLEDSALSFLYGGAFALLFPSLMEGFGLPVLESMACGTPVITFKRTGIKEAAGDAGIFIEPNDMGSLFEALEKLKNPEFYERVRELGLKHIRNFSWEKTAERIFEIYRKILNG